MNRTDPPHSSRLTPHGTGTTVLAFDFGEKRIGVAVGDTAVGIAHPLTTIHAADKQRRCAAIAALVGEWQPAQVVVGLPAHLDGTEHALSRLARKFARDLATRFGLPVEFVDERLTSAAAESSLAAAGVAPRKRKSRVDQVAAQEILQDYFDAGLRAARSAGGAPASREQGSRLRDATARESGAAPSSAGVASVSGVTSPEGARRRAEEGPLRGSDPEDAHRAGIDAPMAGSTVASPQVGPLLHVPPAPVPPYDGAGTESGHD